MKSEKFINEQKKKKKTQIDIIYADIDVSNVKRKRIEKALSNVSTPGEDNYFNINMAYAPKKDDYLHIHIIFLNELNDQSRPNLISNDFNILNAINQINQDENPINLITNPDLNKSLTFVKFMDLDIRVILNSDCIRHFFINHSIFIIYDKIQSRSIKNIENVKIQPLVCDIINLNYNVNDKRVTLMILNVLHVSNMSVNLFSIKKLLDVNIEIAFHKKGCALTQNNITLIDIRNHDLFFLNL